MKKVKKTKAELQADCTEMNDEIYNLNQRYASLTKEERDRLSVLCQKRGEIVTAVMRMEQDEYEAKKKAFVSRQDIRNIRMLMESAVMQMKMPVYYSRSEADSNFSLMIVSYKNVQCGGYAVDELGEKTSLGKISLMDLGGILEYGEEASLQKLEKDEED